MVSFSVGLAAQRMIRLCLLLACGLLVTNCATVTRGTVDQIQIVSEPSGAAARTSIGHSCTTPCTLTVDRKAEFTVSVVKDGYREANVPVATKLAGAGAAGLAGNIIIGGIVGVVADAATGATLEHYPNPVSVTLEPLQPAHAVKGRKPARSQARPKPPADPSSIIAPEEEPPPTT